MTQPELVPLDADNWRTTLEVRTRPDQLPFVASYEPVALVILAKAYLGAAGLRWHPFAVKRGDGFVGVVALAHPEPPDDCEIFHLAIDAAHQKQGIGRAVLGLAEDWVRRELPDCRRLSLAVHPDNRVARRLYESAGFEPLGIVRDGEDLMARAL